VTPSKTPSSRFGSDEWSETKDEGGCSGLREAMSIGDAGVREDLSSRSPRTREADGSTGSNSLNREVAAHNSQTND